MIFRDFCLKIILSIIGGLGITWIFLNLVFVKISGICLILGCFEKVGVYDFEYFCLKFISQFGLGATFYITTGFEPLMPRLPGMFDLSKFFFLSLIIFTVVSSRFRNLRFLLIFFELILD